MNRIAIRLAFAVVAVTGLAACGSSPEPERPVAASTAVFPMCQSGVGETAADRIVRLHTETMVAGLGCGSFWRDAQAPVRYGQFLTRNADLLRRSQAEVAQRLGGNGRFDEMHTVMSNQESLRMMRLGSEAYCMQMRENFYRAVTAPSTELAQAAATFPASASGC